MGMESILPGTEDQRSLDRRRGADAHKLPGTSGSNICRVLYQGKDWNRGTAEIGQYISGGLHKQPGGTVSPELVRLDKDLWMWCLDRNIHITAQDLPGKLNEIADAESRTVRD